MELTQTAAQPEPMSSPAGARVLRRPLRRAWWCGLCLCLLLPVPGIKPLLVAGMLLGITFSMIDLFIMLRGIQRTVAGGSGRKGAVRNYFTRYLLLAAFLAVARLAGTASFWGAVAGFVITRGWLVLDGLTRASEG